MKVFEDYLRLRKQGNLETDIERNHAEDDVVVMSNFGIFHGREGDQGNMTKQRRNRNSDKKQKRDSQAGTNVVQDTAATQQTESPDESTRLWQEEMSSGVSEDTAYESSSEVTGGGVDTPTAVEKSTEAAIRKRKKGRFWVKRDTSVRDRKLPSSARQQIQLD